MRKRKKSIEKKRWTCEACECSGAYCQFYQLTHSDGKDDRRPQTSHNFFDLNDVRQVKLQMLAIRIAPNAVKRYMKMYIRQIHTHAPDLEFMWISISKAWAGSIEIDLSRSISILNFACASNHNFPRSNFNQIIIITIKIVVSKWSSAPKTQITQRKNVKIKS